MSTIAFRKGAVIGAGTMGSGIAAHLANAGLEVVLLDLDAEVASAAIGRQLKAGGFMLPDFAKRIKTGSTKTDLGLLADADWIIEAVAERLDIKHALFNAIDQVRKPESIVSSNTSTLPLHQLVEGLSPALASRFLIAHFFNPPRQMRLLELVSGPKTAPEVTAAIRQFCDVNLGKGVVSCKDTPGFIGNRIGCYWLAAGLNEAIKLGLDVEAADFVMGKPFGFPKTGIFGLYDLIGNDLMPALIRSLQSSLPATDPVHAYAAEPELLAGMLKKGLTGRKGGGGFYKLSADRKTKEVIDLSTGDYRAQKGVEAEVQEAAKGDGRALLSYAGPAGLYAKAVLIRTLSYAAALVPEIADRPDEVDEAMRIGYGWKYGPFELIDRIGASWLADQLKEEGTPVPPLLAGATSGQGFYRVEKGEKESLTEAPSGPAYSPIPVPEGVISLAALKLKAKPVTQSEAASLWDLGDGIGLFEFHTKMNVFTQGLLEAVGAMVVEAPKHFSGVVIGNEGPAFSAGADLSAILALSEKGDGAAIESFIRTGLASFNAVKYAPFPIVAAQFGAALGGGCEIGLHAHAIAAHAEATIGLVEVRVGLIPGWAGIIELLIRLLEQGLAADVAVAETLERVLGAASSAGAYDAQARGLLRPTDKVTMNRDRLIADAKAIALSQKAAFKPFTPPTFTLPAASLLEDRLTALGDKLAPHDKEIGKVLVGVLSGSGAPISEQELNERITKAFVALALTQPSRDRIAQMIKTGKPLRN
ncbi:3-hydroxyacyl-CoA dehydrogenase/enoyl-CoA hydratase family protein [Beijerinckia indica]|uniref:3-hydroxyacyl-CoA dehydrogenase NAD-binding n=1 Tax=Beijerinckia indica subsp. indica (strain ATCC 9039 / DSM 1715 / NCIMB 8712) TaxID=395963 RepID=B2ID64_BEII9|nr:3-hydroxyacyl-CoA dehydrogenase/enoyl-CoA hydratase family protein [Beijerinckia indica]ACB96829.1 3-hydroxyacyl-CoA dehydrogenase NAD-binding [Beijerinckia indica subsp. indica ATCC 9039]